MKRSFLVVYDYGQGGVWAFINATSRAEIKRRFPEFEVFDKPPGWMSADVLARLSERMTFDIDDPRGWLADVVAERKRRGDDIAAG